MESDTGKKLGWMYKSPNEMVNREDYLLGRPIDKPFEQLIQAEKNVSQNHVEHECVPPSLRSFSGNEQVDLVRKMQEDPLYTIKKKEMETRSQLLKNPVKLKQLRQWIEEQSKKARSERRLSKEEQQLRSIEEADIDVQLITKLKDLKRIVGEEYLIASIEKIKGISNKKVKQKTISGETGEEHVNTKTKKPSRRSTSHNGRNTTASWTRISKERTEDRVNKVYEETRRSGSTHNGLTQDRLEEGKKRVVTAKPKLQLTEEEKDRRRQEMMANAAWRDKEREKNVKMYAEQEFKEVNDTKSYKSDFLRRHLAVTAEKGTVASRIKSNINNIQRSGRCMDTNFAKR